MLDAFIIEQIRRREEERDRERQRIQPTLERPGSMPYMPPNWQPPATWDRHGESSDRRHPDAEDGRIVIDM